MKDAILIVSFGTTHLDALEKNICAVERDIQAAYPETSCFRAFTSPTVRRRLKEKFGIEIDSVEEALQKIKASGFTHVTVQPTLLLPGEEYDRLRRDVLTAAGDLCISIGLPLLWEDGDIQAMARILKRAYPTEEDTILLAMGHGTSHAADSVYFRLRKAMTALGMELCTVEGSIDFDGAIKNLLNQPRRKVHLVPLLLVAGDHSKNDMAGDEPDSLKSRLTAAGFSVTCSLAGLGEIPEIRQAFIARVKREDAHVCE